MTEPRIPAQPLRLGTRRLDEVVVHFPAPPPPARLRLRDQLPEHLRGELDECFSNHPCNPDRRSGD